MDEESKKQTEDDNIENQKLTAEELEQVTGGITVTKQTDSTSPLLFRESLIGKGEKTS